MIAGVGHFAVRLLRCCTQSAQPRPRSATIAFQPRDGRPIVLTLMGIIGIDRVVSTACNNSISGCAVALDIDARRFLAAPLGRHKKTISSRLRPPPTHGFIAAGSRMSAVALSSLVYSDTGDRKASSTVLVGAYISALGQRFSSDSFDSIYLWTLPMFIARGVGSIAWPSSPPPGRRLPAQGRGGNDLPTDCRSSGNGTSAVRRSYLICRSSPPTQRVRSITVRSVATGGAHHLCRFFFFFFFLIFFSFSLFFMFFGRMEPSLSGHAYSYWATETYATARPQRCFLADGEAHCQA